MIKYSPKKPWLLPPNAKPLPGGCLVSVVAKHTGNIYLGAAVGGASLDAVSAGIANLASHGEMGIKRIVLPTFPYSFTLNADQLIDLLAPSAIEIEGPDHQLVETKRGGGNFLHHFGFRKTVMHLSPQTLLDHAWVACALSYSHVPLEAFPCPSGRGIAGGIAAVVKGEGLIFRGSGVSAESFKNSMLISPRDSLEVSLLANGRSWNDIDESASISSQDEFFSHRFFKLLHPHTHTVKSKSQWTDVRLG